MSGMTGHDAEIGGHVGPKYPDSRCMLPCLRLRRAIGCVNKTISAFTLAGADNGKAINPRETTVDRVLPSKPMHELDKLERAMAAS